MEGLTEDGSTTSSLTSTTTREYQQEMLNASLLENIIIAQDTGSGKTRIAVLRMKIEAEREPRKVSWFLAPTVALCEQQRDVISQDLPVSVGLIYGALEPKQWKDIALWKGVLQKHRIIVTTPQVLLDALSHGYINLGQDIGLLVFDEAHHAVANDPMNRIMADFYFKVPPRHPSASNRGLQKQEFRVERPMILGLTASPIFGGNAALAFQTLEANLDSVIRSPRNHRGELSTFVHRPLFRHVLYAPPPYYGSKTTSLNLEALKAVLASMNIEEDPYVISLRSQLAKSLPGPDHLRIDQKLSKTIQKNNTYTHKGFKDLVNTASDIYFDLGRWAADWYIERVIAQAMDGASPYDNITTSWQLKEKTYLRDNLSRIEITPVSYEGADIEAGISDKARVLIKTLEEEKARAESFDEPYSGLVFVTRRDAVLALAEILTYHPRTAQHFRVGGLIGSSEGSYRTSLLDITRKLLRQPQSDTLGDFRSGEKNLIVATAVAEEGLDIQACGNVIRWDVPNNMASWAQSRGRARRKRSSFVLMFEAGGIDSARILQFEQLEKQMMDLYHNDQRLVGNEVGVDMYNPAMDEDSDVEFRVDATGALLTLQSSVPHLNHFCSVLPNARHGGHLPIYDIEPQELPVGWHSLDPRAPAPPPYPGPFGCTVTLPRLLPPELRVFTVAREYRSKRSAHQHAAFKAYLALYDAGLLNDHLLPLTSVVEPDLEEEVKALLKDVEKRSGTASVASQMDPWLPKEGHARWWATQLSIEGLPALRMFTRVEPARLEREETPTLYHRLRGNMKVDVNSLGAVDLSPTAVLAAQHSTRRLFWSLYGSRMSWDDVDFAYMFETIGDVDNALWESRRAWLKESLGGDASSENAFANAEAFGNAFSFPNDVTWVRDGRPYGRIYRFVSWKIDQVSTEEEGELRAKYSRLTDIQITYPLLVVEPLPSRTNFLLPLPPHSTATTVKRVLLLPQHSSIDLLSAAECEHSALLPSIIRHLSVTMTVHSLRSNLLANTALRSVPFSLLTEAITAPVAQDQTHYQRLESLGDAVLKFIVAMELLAAYPLWHEGYLTKRKDHAVSNARLAKEALAKSLYQWIIRDRFSPRRFKPKRLLHVNEDSIAVEDEAQDEPIDGRKSRKEIEELSTKMLADVVEALIGAAYVHGGFDLGIGCAKLFGLGLTWQTLSSCVDTVLSRVENTDDIPTQITDVERMLGYEFSRKLLLVEALTHASYQFDLRTVSYERMEFLGDSLLDMVVTDYLYRYSAKEFSPGQIHIRKSAVVNTHFLAYICLRCSLEVDASMPGPGKRGSIVMRADTQHIYLWQCLLHSSHIILEEQKATFARFRNVRAEIEEGLQHGSIFPWAALTRLQAPKLFSDIIESLLGAVYLDSGGNLDAVRGMLKTLGVLPCLERIVHDEVDVLHPVSRLSIWAARAQKTIEYHIEKEKGNVICSVVVEGKETIQAEAEKRGRASQEQAKFAAAEKAIVAWNVRDTDGIEDA
ncbi:P-loop containing nucleoside triphosphate hydrolase protein [Leucogyrophana mollusca]|uniref:P-loop containing nucleoside triphosphate hydrolase protein n=1 Tax=Leucogyrophana mollusca TaxID=85980 RepID=A0ACB8BIH3_9AGAM|nr:P-loop containing nucleoside triphosphate hydrolase protein [Leucogyrophana mollusca]